MPKLVNITNNEDMPLYIDAMSVTSVYFDTKETALYITNSKGTLLNVNYTSLDVAPDLLLEKLAKAGNKLVYFPARNEDKEYKQYISPSAVTFVTVTEPGNDGHIGAIVGVKGAGNWVESYKTKPEELRELLDAMKGVGKSMLEIMPDEGHARWHNSAALYIDPASITSVRDTGYQVVHGCLG